MATTTFTFNGIEYKHNESTKRYSKTENGKTVRISKEEYEIAFDTAVEEGFDGATETPTAWDCVDSYIYDVTRDTLNKMYKSVDKIDKILDAFSQKKSILGQIEDAANTMNEKSFIEFLKGKVKSVLGAEEATEKKKRVRKGANVTTTVWYNPKTKTLVGESEGEPVHLTGKQVEFLKHLPDSCYWEHGLNSALWTDILCDEIGGEFTGKPMTIGAMISTLREKGIFAVGIGTVNNKKCKYIELTDMGKEIAHFIGVK